MQINDRQKRSKIVGLCVVGWTLSVGKFEIRRNNSYGSVRSLQGIEGGITVQRVCQLIYCKMKTEFRGAWEEETRKVEEDCLKGEPEI